MPPDNIENEVQRRELQTLAHYVISCRGVGHFLPFGDYEVLQSWYHAARNLDEVLIALHQELPPFYQRHRNRGGPIPNLKRLDARIRKGLRHQQKRVLGIEEREEFR